VEQAHDVWRAGQVSMLGMLSCMCQMYLLSRTFPSQPACIHCMQPTWSSSLVWFYAQA
jgi:hypothetical protein